MPEEKGLGREGEEKMQEHELPPVLQKRIVTESLASIERGRAARRVMIATSSVILTVTLALIAFGFSVTGIFPLAVIIGDKFDAGTVLRSEYGNGSRV